MWCGNLIVKTTLLITMNVILIQGLPAHHTLVHSYEGGNDIALDDEIESPRDSSRELETSCLLHVRQKETKYQPQLKKGVYPRTNLK